MNHEPEKEIPEHLAPTLSSVVMSLTVFGSACAGCIGIALSAAVIAPLTGFRGAWQLALVVSISATATLMTSRHLSKPKLGITIVRATTSSALIYFGVIGIVAIVSAFSGIWGGSGGGPTLP
ncbi:MAG: hypothetical protein ACC652_08190 [Acidimicrobiales bacterium]